MGRKPGSKNKTTSGEVPEVKKAEVVVEKNETPKEEKILKIEKKPKKEMSKAEAEAIVSAATSDSGYLEPNKAKMKAVIEAMKQMDSKYGKGTVIKLGDRVAIKTEVIPTGAMSLDIALGVGGLPKGRIIELFGPEMSGKSTLAMQIIAEAQKLGGICAYIDAENAMDKEYASKIGVDTDNLMLSQPDWGEQGLEIAENFVRSGGVDVIVVDSVAALLPKAELEGEMGQQFMGLQARMMSQAMRKLTAIVNKSKTIIIFINQIRDKIGIAYGNPEVTPGGRALKFYSSVRIDMRKKEAIKEGDKVLGNHVLAKVVKNKVAAPFTHAEFDIIFGKGVDKVSAILSSAENCGVVTKSGAFYSYGDIKIGHGQGGAVAYLAEHKDILDKIGKETMAKSITVVEVKGAEDEEIPEMPESEIEPVNPETTEVKENGEAKDKDIV
jgi:recombination protein RecA